MDIKEIVGQMTGLKIKRFRLKTFYTLEHSSFQINYRIDDELVILWITTYRPCEGLGSCLIEAFKYFSTQEKLYLVADQVTEEAIPFWLKVGFAPIPYTLDFDWVEGRTRRRINTS